jgi:catechol 1,2-dioxygenase
MSVPVNVDRNLCALSGRAPAAGSATCAQVGRGFGREGVFVSDSAHAQAGRDDAEAITRAVLRSFADTPDPRTRELFAALTAHLHAFVAETGLTPDEWQRAVGFLTETGHRCDAVRQEFILLSDVLGVSSLVDTLAHPLDPRTTESTVLGPFHVVDSPPRELGADLSLDGVGEPCRVSGVVRSADGTPLPGATVDVWQADSEGWYDVQRPGELPERNLRGLFTADDQGRYRFRTVVPKHYSIPTDGPVGALLRAADRHPYRPAHIHLIAEAPGHERLTTHIFVADSPYLDEDAVFGVKPGLVRGFPDVSFDLVLHPTPSGL